MSMSYFKQQAYFFIKEKILKCEYMPNSFLNERMLQEELNCSRTPIREALNRLEQEHLLRIIPKKGILISDLSINEISMLYETRLLIEPYIIRTYGKHVLQQDLDMFEKLFTDSIHNENMAQSIEIDDKFHRTLCEACANTYLLASLEETAMQNQRVRILSGLTKGRIVQSQEEHLLVLSMMLAKEYEKAAQAMEKHLLKAEEEAFKLLVSNRGWVNPEIQKA